MCYKVVQVLKRLKTILKDFRVLLATEINENMKEVVAFKK